VCRFGEHASGAGAAFAAVVVEQHGFLDAGEVVEQFGYGHGHAGLAGLVALEVVMKEASTVAYTSPGGE